MDFEDLPRGRIVGFRATDGVALSGALFEPERRGEDAVVFLHGNGDSSIFRSERTNVLARGLVDRRITFLPFDNRGSGLLRWLKRKRGEETGYLTGGMTHEIIRDCVHDIDGALRLLRSLGYRRLHLAGHSTGANKIVLYHFLKPRNTVSSYALLAPGDDTGLYYRALGPKRFRKAIERCRDEIRKGRGDRAAPVSWSPFPISYASLLDTLDPEGDYNIFPFFEALEGIRLSKKKPFRELATVRKRTVAVYGTEDEFCLGRAADHLEVLERQIGDPSRLTAILLEGADHGFHGRQTDLAEILAMQVVRK